MYAPPRSGFARWRAARLYSPPRDSMPKPASRAFFKCENLQRGGAFKIRGAANLVLSLPRESLARGVVAYSSGNHAQATAIAARYVGVPATIVMPEDAPRSKMEATRAHGARIVTYNRFTDSREAHRAEHPQGERRHSDSALRPSR